jgi:hypothetical protein
VAQAEFIRFLTVAGSDPEMLARYEGLNLPRLLFHAKNEGYQFTAADAHAVVGRLEFTAVTEKDHEPFDGNSGLWVQMWGQRYLTYIVDRVMSRFDGNELMALSGQEVP